MPLLGDVGSAVRPFDHISQHFWLFEYVVDYVWREHFLLSLLLGVICWMNCWVKCWIV